jgi:hypothetical protein
VKSLSLNNIVSVSSLPAASSSLEGCIVRLTTDGEAYWCTGTKWTPMIPTTLQIITGTISAYSGTTSYPITAAPTTSGGTQIWSQSITTTVGSRILLKCQLFGDTSVNNRFITVAFFRNSTIIGVTTITIATSGTPASCSYMDYDNGLAPGTYTYSCRVGGGGSGTWYINQNKSGNNFGGSFSNAYSLTEII